MTNGAALPFVVPMTCLNGYFEDVYTDSLGKALVEAPGGAICGLGFFGINKFGWTEHAEYVADERLARSESDDAEKRRWQPKS